MDPDKWAFANEWFLRGQTHLLKNIARRKHNTNSSSRNSHHNSTIHHKYEYEEGGGGGGDEDSEDELLTELNKLKKEQKELDQELAMMNKRLEATERRPQQMMAFLCKVVEDPEILPKMILEKERTKRLNYFSTTEEKKRKLMMISSSVSSPPTSSSGMAMTASYCSSSTLKSENQDHEEDAATTTLRRGISSSPEPNLDIDYNFYPSSPSPETSQRPNYYSNSGSLSLNNYCYNYPTAAAVAPLRVECSNINYGVYDNDGYVGDSGGMVVGEGGASATPPYPFSLLGGGF